MTEAPKNELENGTKKEEEEVSRFYKTIMERSKTSNDGQSLISMSNLDRFAFASAGGRTFRRRSTIERKFGTDD